MDFIYSLDILREKQNKIYIITITTKSCKRGIIITLVARKGKKFFFRRGKGIFFDVAASILIKI